MKIKLPDSYAELNNELSNADYKYIGETYLGYIPKAATKRARRFFLGWYGELKNWEYNESFNYGDLAKVRRVLIAVTRILKEKL